MTTNIEWARNPDGTKGETWPVVTGCTPCSAGCDHCYAARMAATRLRDHPRYKGLAIMHNGKPKWTGKVNLNYDVLEQPLHFRKPRMIFVASMGDLFHDDVPDAFISKVFRRMLVASSHTFQVLTKRPDRMSEYVQGHITDRLFSVYGTRFEWPPANIWFGTSIENQAAADERIPILKRIPAMVRFVSFEPLLSRIIVGSNIKGSTYDRWLGISWAIVGGESGPGARPMNPNWARSLRDQCKAANVPMFMKQMGAWQYYGENKPSTSYGSVSRRNVCQTEDGWYYKRASRKGSDMQYWPRDLRIREFPE